MAARCKGIAGEGSAAAAAPPHVLAVDDSSVDRAVIASILRSSQFRGEQSANPPLSWERSFFSSSLALLRFCFLL